MLPDAARNHVEQLEHADQHQRDSRQEGQEPERLPHRVSADALRRYGFVGLELDSQTRHEQQERHHGQGAEQEGHDDQLAGLGIARDEEPAPYH
jgi:hypothetical protein